MKPEQTLDELTDKIKQALRKEKMAEKTRVKSEQKKIAAHYEYLLLMDIFRAREYTI